MRASVVLKARCAQIDQAFAGALGLALAGEASAAAALAFFGAAFLGAAAFAAGAFFPAPGFLSTAACLPRVFFTGPFSARAARSATASSRVTELGSESRGSVALILPSV